MRQHKKNKAEDYTATGPTPLVTTDPMMSAWMETATGVINVLNQRIQELCFDNNELFGHLYPDISEKEMIQLKKDTTPDGFEAKQ